MSAPEAAVEAAARSFPGYTPEDGADDLEREINASCRSRARAILEAALPILLAPVLALHPKTCEQIGDSCQLENCPTMVCGPCGETWPCPTVAALQ